MRSGLPLILALLVLAGCQKSEPEPVAATPAPETTIDPSGAAPPQPNPNGGDTPAGVAGMEGQSPNAPDAVQQGDPSAPGTTSPPR